MLCVYHLHTDLSLLDSCSRFDEYLALAKSQGMTAIGCSEHGRISNWAGNKLAAKQAGLKYLHCCEVYVTSSLEPKQRDNMHSVLIARDREGTIELNRLIKLASEPSHFYYSPRITFDELRQISPHIIKTSACLASPLNRIDPSDDRYMDWVRCYDYLEIQHHPDESQCLYNQRLLKLSRQTGIPLIAGTDTHASSQAKADARRIMMLYKEQAYPGEENFDLVWKSEDELLDAYAKQGALPKSVYTEAIQNTQVMADSCEDWDLDTSIKYPVLYGSREEDTKKLWQLSYQRLDEKLESGAIPKPEEEAYRSAIKEEMAVYEKLDMCGFILCQAEIAHWCRTNDIPLGPARGSVSGSRVAYVTDIIDFDCERWKTMFSRFANEHRKEPGDIDTDCVDTDRPRIFQFIRDKFGEEHCARVASYGTIADLAFIDDCGGGLALEWEKEHFPYKFKDNGRMDKVKYKFDNANPYHPLKLKKIKEEFRSDPEQAKNKHPDIFQYFDAMVGTRVSQSVHPAGIVVSPLVLGDEYGVFWKDGESCLTIDMDICHECGAIKLDYLVLKSIAVIKDICALIGKPYPHMYEIDWDDQDVWKDMSRDPLAVFQFESPFAAESLTKFKPKSVFELALLSAALRPSGQSYRDDLIARKQHKNPSALIDEILKDNNGWLVYQCDILVFLQNICGLSGSDADSVRRGIAKKKMEILEEWMPTILEGYCAHSDKPRAEAEEECKEYLNVIEDASAYMFSKNHSIPYSMISYLFSYYKHYYPEQFVAAYMKNAANDDDIATGKAIAKARGINMSKPKFRQDNRSFYIDPVNHVISDSLTTVKGIGLKDAEALYNLRDRQYSTFVELLRDMTLYTGALNIAVVEKLIKLDYFSEFGCIKRLLKLYDAFYNGPTCFKTTLVPASQAARMQALMNYELGTPDLLGETHSELDGLEDDPVDIVRYEVELYGEPTSVAPRAKGQFVVLDVDTKYSPRLQLYSVATGKKGQMKVLKKTYEKQPVVAGDWINIVSWTPKEAYGRPGVMEQWINTYNRI